MAESFITTGGADSWVNSAKTGANYGDTGAVHVKSTERRAFCRPPLPNILGRTVTSAVLYGHAGPSGLVAQQLDLRPALSHWTQGRITWANQPDVSSTPVNVVIGALNPGDLVAWDVTDHLQAVADGTEDYHGWRIATDSTSTGQRFVATQSGDPAWELHVSLAFDAAEPDNLRPDGGGAVGSSTPIVAWDFDDQAEFNVQVDTPAAGVDPDEVAPDHDSGWVTSVDPEYDLAAAVYTPPAGSDPTFWRVRARDTDGNESGWTPWAEFTVAALPVLIIDAPTGAIGDPAPTVEAHLSSGTLESWRVWATGPDRSDIRWRSGRREGPISLQIPRKNDDGRRIFREDESCWISIRAWDDVDRTVAVGEETTAHEWVSVSFGSGGASVVSPTNLSVSQQLDGDPRLVWQFSITDLPESFKFMVDGVTVEQKGSDDIDLDINAGVVTWTDGGQVSPLRPHTLAVHAVSDGWASVPATVNMWQHTVEGVWLIPDANIEPVWLAGTAVSGFSQGDRTATYTPVKGDPVDITYDWEGVSGTFEGVVDSRQVDVWAALERIDRLRRNRNRLARLVWGSQSIVVRVRDIHATPSDAILPSNLEHVVRFGFVQVGD